MSLQRTTLTRVFVANGVRLADPNPAFPPTKVVAVLAAAGRPELATARIVGPEEKAGILYYTLHRDVGTKGSRASRGKAHNKADEAQRAAARRAKALRLLEGAIAPSNRELASAFEHLTSSSRGGSGPMLTLPAQVLPCLA